MRTEAGSLYVGISTDVARRFREHSGGKRGAKFLKNKGRLTLEFSSDAKLTCGEALRVEKLVKSMAKARKERVLAELRAGAQTVRGILEKGRGRVLRFGWLTRKIRGGSRRGAAAEGSGGG